MTSSQRLMFLWRKSIEWKDLLRRFNRHIQLCDNYFENEKALPILPNEMNNIFKFKKFHKSTKYPLVYYADLEAVLKKVNSKNKIQKHEACSYSILALSDFYKNFKLYTGTSAKDTTNYFIQSLIEEGKKINKILHGKLSSITYE